jgi:histidine triad (HIT) family protein
MDGCIFCKIINGEIPSTKLYEDEKVLAFLDIHPIKPGHTLIIPKKHFENFVSTDEEYLLPMIQAAKKIAPAIIKSVGASAFNFTTANGAEAGQSVFHLHFHIIPRFSKSELKDWPEMEGEQPTRIQIADAISKIYRESLI